MLCRTKTHYARVLRRLNSPETTHIVIDVETSGLDWRTNYVVGYVITFGTGNDDNFYLPIRHSNNNLCNHTPPSGTDWVDNTTIHNFLYTLESYGPMRSALSHT